MDVYLNELCLYHREGIDQDQIIKFLYDQLRKLKDKGVDIHTFIQRFKEIIKDWNLKPSQESVLLEALRHVNQTNFDGAQLYFHFFRHQDFELSVSKNISDSSLASAAHKVSKNEKAIILNIPLSHFCSRSYIPVILSPYESSKLDKLVNVPCFDDADKIHRYKLVHGEVSKQLTDPNKFDVFCREYDQFAIEHDYSNWTPRTMLATDQNRLDPAHAFPASSRNLLATELDSFTIVKRTYEENVVEYTRLGKLVLNLHGYSFNKKLSQHYGKDIFEAGRGNHKLLVSIDTENGGFEAIHSDGNHIGVYGYSGRFLKRYTDKNDIKKHSLHDLPSSMFLF